MMPREYFFQETKLDAPPQVKVYVEKSPFASWWDVNDMDNIHPTSGHWHNHTRRIMSHPIPLMPGFSVTPTVCENWQPFLDSRLMAKKKKNWLLIAVMFEYFAYHRIWRGRLISREFFLRLVVKCKGGWQGEREGNKGPGTGRRRSWENSRGTRTRKF